MEKTKNRLDIMFEMHDNNECYFNENNVLINQNLYDYDHIDIVEGYDDEYDIYFCYNLGISDDECTHIVFSTFHPFLKTHDELTELLED